MSVGEYANLIELFNKESKKIILSPLGLFDLLPGRVLVSDPTDKNIVRDLRPIEDAIKPYNNSKTFELPETRTSPSDPDSLEQGFVHFQGDVSVNVNLFNRFFNKLLGRGELSAKFDKEKLRTAIFEFKDLSVKKIEKSQLQRALIGFRISDDIKKDYSSQDLYLAHTVYYCNKYSLMMYDLSEQEFQTLASLSLAQIQIGAGSKDQKARIIKFNEKLPYAATLSRLSYDFYDRNDLTLPPVYQQDKITSLLASYQNNIEINTENNDFWKNQLFLEDLLVEDTNDKEISNTNNNSASIIQ